jgi:hypothetical protein
VAEINRGEYIGTLPSKEEKLLFNAIWGKKMKKKRRKLKNGTMRKRKEKN